MIQRASVSVPSTTSTVVAVLFPVGAVTEKRQRERRWRFTLAVWARRHSAIQHWRVRYFERASVDVEADDAHRIAIQCGVPDVPTLHHWICHALSFHRGAYAP